MKKAGERDVGIGGKYGFGGEHPGWGRGAGPGGAYVPFENRPRPVFLPDPKSTLCIPLLELIDESLPATSGRQGLCECGACLPISPSRLTSP